MTYTEPAQAASADQNHSIRELVQDMRAGSVDALFILGGNPVFTAPSDLDFEAALALVTTSIYLGIELDETAARSSWHIPANHYLESWGDARTFDGTVSIQQPLILPLYNGRSGNEVLQMLTNDPQLSAYSRNVPGSRRSPHP